VEPVARLPQVQRGLPECYVYRRDAKYELDASVVRIKTPPSTCPCAGRADGSYKSRDRTTWPHCFTSDFLLDAADEWRAEAWRMIRARPDLNFFFITKRICASGAPARGLGRGVRNVSVGVTCENQAAADERLPYFLSLPIRSKTIVCEPMLEAVDLRTYLSSAIRQSVVAGGESGENARLMRYVWAADLSRQCKEANVPFWFKQTGARFEKDGRVYRIPRRLQFSQARKSGLSRP
jgi:protein gp37